MKTLNKFVLVDGDSKRETLLNWNDGPLSRTLQLRLSNARLGDIAERKKIMAELNLLPEIRRSGSTVSKQQQSTILNRQQQSVSTMGKKTNVIFTNPELTQHTERVSVNGSTFATPQKRTFRRAKSFISMRRNESERSKSKKQFSHSKNDGVSDFMKLKEMLTNCDSRIVCVLRIKNDALHPKIISKWIPLHNDFDMFSKEIRKQMFREFDTLRHKKVYLFHRNTFPINKVSDIENSENVIFADVSPKM